jgi:hypothetical protein
MHIKGSGFSTNMNNDGNVVVIGGKYKCDVIPLHCTVNQIACKTQNAMTGAEMRTWASHRTTFPDGWIDDMDVQVTVDGARNSTCRPDSGASCTFSYHTGWYRKFSSAKSAFTLYTSSEKKIADPTAAPV